MNQRLDHLVSLPCLLLNQFQLPTQDQLKTVLDKVKDFFGDAKESFGKLTALGSLEGEESDENSTEKAK